MKHLLIAAIAVVWAASSQAQTQQDAVVMTMNERYELAEEAFNKLLQASPTNAQLYFYAGDNYLYWGEMEKAEKMYRRGTEVDPLNPLNFAGLGRIAWMKGDAARNQAQFGTANELMNAKGNTLDKSTKELAYLKMAEAYVQGEKKNLDQALVFLNQALNLSKNKKGELTVTNPEVYLQLGDYYAEKDGFNLTNALMQYSEAYKINQKYTRTLLRQGQLYVRVKNWDEGLSYFNQAIEVDPTFAPAYREKAELLYKAGRYNTAIETYAKYLELNNNCRVQQRYASFIYLTKDYKKAVEEIENAIPCNPDNLIMYRVLGYAYYELGDYAKGMENIDRYFSMAEAKDKTIITGTDIAYKGKLLAKTGQDSLGIELIKEAMARDTSYKEGYGEIATIYSKSKKYAQAAEWFQMKIDASSEKAPLDYYYLGQSHYYAKDYAKADAAFTNATEKYPDAWFWRGRCNNRMDDQANPAGLAKPFFEKAIREVMRDERNIEPNKKNLVEAYSYLGLFYGKQDNYECSKAAWNKVVEYDPQNKVASDVMADPKMAAAIGSCELIPAE